MSIPKDIDEIARSISVWRYSKGFVTPASIDTEQERHEMLGKLMLVVTEVAEAAEAIRHNDRNNFKEELADIMIRVLDICHTMGITPSYIIQDKMGTNRQRPIKHGKQVSL